VETYLLVIYIALVSLVVLLFLIYLIRTMLIWMRLNKPGHTLSKDAGADKPKKRVKIPAPKYKLDAKTSYFMFDKGSETGYGLLKAYCARERNCLCITHFNPKGIQKRFGLGGASFIWLTREKDDVKGQRIIPPTSLGFVLQELEERVDRPNTIVYIDSLEKCFALNGYERTRKFLTNLRTLVEKKDATLLLSIEQSGTNKKVREFLKSQFKELK
jgi:hypothetical protein